MFLSNALIDEWLPTIIKIRKESLCKNTSNPEHSEQSNNINPFIDGEVNILVGWAIFASLKKTKRFLITKLAVNSMLLEIF